MADNSHSDLTYVVDTSTLSICTPVSTQTVLSELSQTITQMTLTQHSIDTSTLSIDPWSDDRVDALEYLNKYQAVSSTCVYDTWTLKATEDNIHNNVISLFIYKQYKKSLHLYYILYRQAQQQNDLTIGLFNSDQWDYVFDKLEPVSSTLGPFVISFDFKLTSEFASLSVELYRLVEKYKNIGLPTPYIPPCLRKVSTNHSPTPIQPHFIHIGESLHKAQIECVMVYLQKTLIVLSNCTSLGDKMQNLIIDHYKSLLRSYEYLLDDEQYWSLKYLHMTEHRGETIYDDFLRTSADGIADFLDADTILNKYELVDLIRIIRN